MAQTLHVEPGPATVAVQLHVGAPPAVPELEAASLVIPELEGAPELETDSEGEELCEFDFVEDEVVVQETAIPKRKKKDLEGSIWCDYNFGEGESR
jgi:hypothetical protein